MASVLFMACNNGANGSYSGGDATLIDQTSQKVLSSFGASAEQIDADLVKLGFEKIDDEINLYAPARYKMPFKKQIKADDNTKSVFYAYNVPDIVLRGEADEIEMINAVTATKKLMVAVEVYFYNDKFVGAEGAAMINASVSGTVTRYENFSNNLYKSIPAAANVLWQGVMYQSVMDEKEERYQEQPKYINDISKAVQAYEYCTAENGDKVYAYELTFMNPDDTYKASMKEAGVTPFCQYGFAVSGH